MKNNHIFKIAMTAFLASTTSTAHAAGFALIEQSASGMGNAFAGGGAIAEDASTIFFNPAGMTYLDGTQLVGALHLIKPNADFNNEGSSAALTKSLGGEGGNAGDLAFVPNLFVKTDLTQDIKLGIGISAPFGLKTDYNKDWMGRYQAVKSELKTININPALAFKVNEQLSIGAGISAMWAQAELTRAVNLGAAGGGFSKVKGDDWGFGYNLGAIYQVTQDTRLSVAYRSKIDQHLEGDVKFNRPAVLPPTLTALTANGNVKADVTLPESFSVSAFSHLNDKWDIMGDITWTRWSQFEELAVYRTSGSLLTRTVENWDNALRYSVGASYHYSDKLTLRTGLAFDEEAISTEYRTARIPGNDRKWLSFGAGWKMTPNSQFDIGYAHLFISDTKIRDRQNNPPTQINGNLIGEYEGSVDILSVQYTHNF